MVSLMYNNPSSTVSTEESRKEITEFLKNVNNKIVLVQAFIVVFGILGNLLALIVINQKSLRNTSSSVFITYLAIFDSSVLLLHGANLIGPRENPLINCSLTYLTDLSTFCANWILVIITLGM